MDYQSGFPAAGIVFALVPAVRRCLGTVEQQIVRSRDGSLKLTFSTASQTEVIAWVLSFGAEARMLTPRWFAKEIKTTALAVADSY